jgi:hypothetical protein
MRNLGTYFTENLRLSFATWGVGQRMSNLIAVLAALVFAFLTLKGIDAEFSPFALRSGAALLG